MVIKLFVLGASGVGKSTAAEYIGEIGKRRGYDQFFMRCDDYKDLQEMFLQDTEHKRFIPTSYDGFDVIDPSALDDALGKVENRVQRILEQLYSDMRGFIVIEFARDDYLETFQSLDSDFLENAYFICISADVALCKERNRTRALNKKTLDDHFVPEHKMEAYHRRKTLPHLPVLLREKYGIDEKRVQFLHNNGSIKDFKQNLGRVINAILTLEMYSAYNTSAFLSSSESGYMFDEPSLNTDPALQSISASGTRPDPESGKIATVSPVSEMVNTVSHSCSAPDDDAVGEVLRDINHVSSSLSSTSNEIPAVLPAIADVQETDATNRLIPPLFTLKTRTPQKNL